MKGIYLRAAVRRQRDVKPAAHGLAAGLDPERWLPFLAKSRGFPEWFHDRVSPTGRRAYS